MVRPGSIERNLGEIKSIVIPLPPTAEQQRIVVAKVERRLSVVEELEAVVHANLQRATRLRQSILQKAFEGKLIDRSQQFADCDRSDLTMAAAVDLWEAKQRRRYVSATSPSWNIDFQTDG